MLIFRKPDSLGGLIFLIIGLMGLLSALRLPPGTLSAPGPGLFPISLGFLLAVLSLALLLRSRRESSAGGSLGLGERGSKVLLALGGLVAYFSLLERLGYLLCGLLILSFLLRVVEQCAWKTTLAVAVITTAGSYILFTYLGIPLPLGILTF